MLRDKNNMNTENIQPVPILMSFEGSQWLIEVHKSIVLQRKDGSSSTPGCIQFHRSNRDGGLSLLKPLVDESRGSYRAAPHLIGKGLNDPYSLKNTRDQYQRQLDSPESPLTLLGRKLLKEKVKTIALLQRAIIEGLIQNYHLDQVTIRPSQSI